MTVSPQLRKIPVWVRVLAGVVVVVAVLAIAVLIRVSPGQVTDGLSFLRLGAEAILYVCISVLFGYVAATGLPPSHWWRNAGRAWWPAHSELPLTPDLHRFLARLRQRHPGIRECWILDAVGQGTHPGEWRFLALADRQVAEGVRSDWEIRRKDVRLYLLDEHPPTVALAWGRSSPVAFATWDWEPQGDAFAEFRCPVAAEIRLAQRLWSEPASTPDSAPPGPLPD